MVRSVWRALAKRFMREIEVLAEPDSIREMMFPIGPGLIGTPDLQGLALK